MNINSRRDVGIFVIVVGVMLYLASVTWAAFFIVALPQDEDWCVSGVEWEDGTSPFEGMCIEFKSEIELLKYYHNVRMRDRNTHLLYVTLALGAFVSFGIFHVRAPRAAGISPQNRLDSTIGSLLFGGLVALLVPMVLSVIMPAPAKWFPRVITEMAEGRRQDALRDLEAHANDMRMREERWQRGETLRQEEDRR